ncbi:ABC superfamily ATP binding cassette transporter, permease protein [Lactobacillus hamsteri DSM 5661 = JCM 6256]|uniref:ABC superfamily ATP binding cassette transporter, permease protein n=1 Tax=Lactobacillus hamsteri DSM 5661 = JCM 6256 TaxID=1423754 RepID=A0A0R1YDW9_9LACO|nr:ABC superfamily ATP binding cassette transporter, permease protein [Lactobacillus hamsteri DSM 5661 = JCM 6256]
MKASLITNLIVIACAFIFLLIKKIKIKDLLLLVFVPLIAAFTVFATLYWFNDHPDHYYAWVLSSRIYVYVFTIACVVKTTTATELARSLEQNMHLPSKFAYGVLAALNIIPRMKMAVKQIRTAGMMRGLYLSFWSPMLYFKAILVALSSAENLAQGIESHGYVEDQKRSAIIKIPLTKQDRGLFIFVLIVFNVCLFMFK